MTGVATAPESSCPDLLFWYAAGVLEALHHRLECGFVSLCDLCAIHKVPQVNWYLILIQSRSLSNAVCQTIATGLFVAQAIERQCLARYITWSTDGVQFGATLIEWSDQLPHKKLQGSVCLTPRILFTKTPTYLKRFKLLAPQ